MGKGGFSGTHQPVDGQDTEPSCIKEASPKITPENSGSAGVPLKGSSPVCVVYVCLES